MHALAVGVVYADVEPDTTPSAAYVERAAGVVREQVVLGGLRLGHCLGAALDASGAGLLAASKSKDDAPLPVAYRVVVPILALVVLAQLVCFVVYCQRQRRRRRRQVLDPTAYVASDDNNNIGGGVSSCWPCCRRRRNAALRSARRQLGGSYELQAHENISSSSVDGDDDEEAAVAAHSIDIDEVSARGGGGGGGGGLSAQRVFSVGEVEIEPLPHDNGGGTDVDEDDKNSVAEL
jgi:hypothetical protein